MPQEPIETYGESGTSQQEQDKIQPLSITFDDLITNCIRCDGTGQEPQPTAPPQSAHSIGRQVLSGPDDSKCTACQGKGRIITPQGEVFAKFIDALDSKGAYRRLTY